MLPLLNLRSFSVALTCLVGLIAGAALQSAPILATSGALIVVLGTAFALAIPQGRALRKQRLEFAWWQDGSGPLIAGKTGHVQCFLLHRGAERLQISEAKAIAPPWLTVSALRSATVSAASKFEFRFDFVLPAAGSYVFHGAAIRIAGPLQLFDTALYFPHPLLISAQPRAYAFPSRRSPSHVISAHARPGRTRLERGGGIDLHEIRDFVAGDPFKSIAWKASARRGQLLVREVEQEAQDTLWCLVEVSSVIRTGAPGARKLDAMTELGAAVTEAALQRGDSAGLITFDTRIVDIVDPASGAGQVVRLRECWTNAFNLVDEDLSDISDAALIQMVRDYVRRQDGIDYLERHRDVQGLLAHAERSKQPWSKSPAASRSHLTDKYAILRSFCRERGLLLPPRTPDTESQITHALAASLKHLLSSPRPAGEVLLLLDSESHLDMQTLRRPIQLLRQRGHHLSAYLLTDTRVPFGEDELGQLFRRAGLATVDMKRRSLLEFGLRSTVVDAATLLKRGRGPVASV